MQPMFKVGTVSALRLAKYEKVYRVSESTIQEKDPVCFTTSKIVLGDTVAIEIVGSEKAVIEICLHLSPEAELCVINTQVAPPGASM